MNTSDFTNKIIQEVEGLIEQAEEIKVMSLEEVSWRASESSWNILECLSHLNLYGDFYLPLIHDKIVKSATKSEQEFHSGLLGAYFAKSMLPKEKLNKMKTFKSKNPIHTDLNKEVIEVFITQQKKLIELIHLSRKVSLSKIRIPTSISSLIQMKLGDTFQFLINHEIRHFHQIEGVKKGLKNYQEEIV